MIKVFFWGKHSNRTPLAYPNIFRYLAGQLQVSSTPKDADIILTGFEKDYLDNIDALRALKGVKINPVLAVISEEPLWEFLWTDNPFHDSSRLLLDGTEWTYIHRRGYLFGQSAYEDLEVPYILTTEKNFVAYYRYLITNHCSGLTAQGIRSSLLESKDIRLAAFLEYRPQTSFEKTDDDHDVISLSRFRTIFCEKARTPSDLITGSGWPGNCRRRQESPDWLLEKLAGLNQNSRLMMAIENAHHKDYVSEKPIDAFACQAIPIVYCNQKNHALFRLVHNDATINLYGKTIEESLEIINNYKPDSTVCDAYHESLLSLKKILIDSRAVELTQKKIASSTLDFLASLLN